jgi:hypothetical protein
VKFLRLLFVELPRAIYALGRAFVTGDWNEDGERDDWTR